MVNSRQKGAQGEREFAKFLRDFGYEARRGQQFSGGKESPDVVTSMEGVHFEVKRVQNLNIQDALDQAEKDGGTGKVPIVAHRKNGEEWKITIYAEDFLRFWQQRVS